MGIKSVDFHSPQTAPSDVFRKDIHLKITFSAVRATRSPTINHLYKIAGELRKPVLLQFARVSEGQYTGILLRVSGYHSIGLQMRKILVVISKVRRQPLNCRTHKQHSAPIVTYMKIGQFRTV